MRSVQTGVPSAGGETPMGRRRRRRTSVLCRSAVACRTHARSARMGVPPAGGSLARYGPHRTSVLHQSAAGRATHARSVQMGVPSAGGETSMGRRRRRRRSGSRRSAVARGTRADFGLTAAPSAGEEAISSGKYPRRRESGSPLGGWTREPFIGFDEFRQALLSTLGRSPRDERAGPLGRRTICYGAANDSRERCGGVGLYW